MGAVVTGTFRLESETTGKVLQVRPIGEFDLLGCEAFDNLLAAAQLDGKRDVTVDLWGLTFIDSSCIRTLIAASKRTSEVGGVFRLIGGRANGRRVFDLSGPSGRLDFVEIAGPRRSRTGATE